MALRAYAPRAVGAYKFARYAYNNRRTVRRAGRAIWRAYSKYKAHRRSAPSVKSTSEAHNTTNTQASALGINELRVEVFDWGPPHESGAGALSNNAYNQRRSHRVLLRGIHVHRKFYGLENGPASWPQSARMYVHWALCQAKSNTGTNSTPVNIELNIEPQFFRDNSDDVKTYKGFNEVANPPGGPAWNSVVHCAPINPETHHIITHKKHLLYKNLNQYQAEGKAVWTINKYFKFNKTVQFDDRTDLYPQRPIYEVFWFTSETPEGFSTGINIRTFAHNKLFFKSLM